MIGDHLAPRRPDRAMRALLGGGRLAAALVAVAAVAVATVVVAAGMTGGGRPHPPTVAPAGFSWLTARPAPASWPRISLPDGTATLAAPPSLVEIHGDPGTVSVGLPAASGDLVYLNATPRQGAETLPDWAEFRIDHLRDENATTATIDAHAEHLTFLGGTGSCVLDDYVTRVGTHHYREIACLVQGAHAASVLIAATPTATWDRYQPVLEQAVNAYTVR
ncbi:MAG TPA: hypothetical protein VLK79_15620 [Gaiellales bacterium]|nr:hypothetical protein [Gaiellales bacterium]